MQMYPGWSARDNYGYGSKKKKRKKERSPADPGGTEPFQYHISAVVLEQQAHPDCCGLGHLLKSFSPILKLSNIRAFHELFY